MKTKLVRIGMMAVLLLALTWVITPKPVLAASKTSTGSCSWNTSGCWSPSGVPGNNDDVTIAAGHTVTLNTNTISLKTLTINGTLQDDGNGRQINVANNGTLTVNGTLDFGTGGVAATGNNQNATLTMGANGLIRTANASGLGPAGSFVNSGSGVWTMTSVSTNGTIEYNATGNQTVTDRNYQNLILSGSGTKTWTRGSARTVNGNLTMSGSAAFTLSGPFVLNIIGNWDDSSAGVLTDATTGAIIFNGTGAQTIGGSALSPFNYLTINNAAGVSLTANLTVNGLLTLTTDLNTGANTLTLGPSSVGAGNGDVIGNTARDTIVSGNIYFFGNPYVRLSMTGVTVPTSVVVNLVKGSAPATLPNAVLRQYIITPTGGSGYTASVRLHYLDTELNGNTETALNLYRYSGSAWVLQAPTMRDDVLNFVEKSGVTSFSPWALATTAPTAVTLSTFNANGDTNGNATLIIGLGIGALVAIGGAAIARKKFSR